MSAMQQSIDQFLFINIVNITLHLFTGIYFLAYVLGQVQHEAAIPQLIEVFSSPYKMDVIVNFQY